MDEQVVFTTTDHVHQCRNCKLDIVCPYDDHTCDFDGLCLYCGAMIAQFGESMAQRIAEASRNL